MRSVALLLVISLSACTMSRTAKPAVTVAGVALTAVGVAMISSSGNDSDGNGRNDIVLNDDLPKAALGGLLALAGIVTAVAGLSASTEPEEPVVFVQPVAAPVPVAAPPFLPPSMAVLPEVAVDAETLQLAKTLRTVTMAGNCDAAKLLLERIALRSHTYFHAIVESPVLDPCPQLR